MQKTRKYLDKHFLKIFGEKPLRIEKIINGISERMVYRVESGKYRCIGVSNEKTAENRAFINFSKVFRKEGLNVPEILHVSRDGRKYLISDLGKKTLSEYQQRISSRDNLIKLYKKALTDLIKFQKSGREKIDFRLCYETRIFDEAQVNYDFNKFCKYYLKGIVNIILDEKKKNSIGNILKGFIQTIPEKYFMYRDFQPRNIIVERNKLGYIDFQSGRMGPVDYDLASFLYSGSIEISPEERKELFEHYATHAEESGIINAGELRKRFYDVVFLRLLQVLGSYGHSIIVKKRTDIIPKIPRAIRNMKSIKRKIKNEELAWLAEMIIGAENYS